MTTIGTPFSAGATRVLLCGAGELGKEVVIELQRYGCEVIALDRYENAPAMQVADRSHTLSMLDGDALRAIIEAEKPDLIVPEIEAIATDTLADLEGEGYRVVPSAKAVQLTMNREGIRRLAAEELELPTSSYRFADNKETFGSAVKEIGFPCIVKPIMSSSGKGQSLIRSDADMDQAWAYAQEGGRAGAGRVIVEGFVDFDYEITLLTVRHQSYDGPDHEGRVVTSYCEPIGHRQENGDYQESWQPQPMNDVAIRKAKEIAESITTALGGCGLFGVELFVKGDEVIFSEVSPRPHDTGLVTLISQELSEFALHVRAILGLPIPNIIQYGPSASAVLLVEGETSDVYYGGLHHALSEINTQVRLFGKPEVCGQRRMGVALSRGADLGHARRKAQNVIEQIVVNIGDQE